MPFGRTLGESPENAVLQLWRGVSVPPHATQSLKEVSLELSPRIARLAYVQVKADLFLGHAIEFAV